MKGKFVVIEGGDGVGKSTQIKLLKEYCTSNGMDTVFTREPGGTPVSEMIRGILLNPDNTAMADMTELMLYAAARAQHIAELIRPALEAGKTVFCDRFTASTIAYQGMGRGMDIEAIKKLDLLAVGDCVPDLTLFLDADPEEAGRRKSGRENADRLENEGSAFHKRVYEGYKLAGKIIGGSFVKVDASGEKPETHAKIIDTLKSYGIL